MIKNWKEFTIGPKDFLTDLHVSMNRKGEILIGARAVEKMGSPGFAVLLYDDLNNCIGISPSNSVTKHAYPLLKNSNGNHRVIRANRLIRHKNIQVTRTIAFTTAHIDDGVLTLDLKETRTIGRAKA